jgi:crossover junction endodeoxyribonuclease RusA
MIVLELPWPKTINHLYGQARNGRRFIRPEGVKFRQAVREIVAEMGVKTMEGRVSVFIAAFPPDKRRRDLDNVLKQLGDSLTHAGVYLDDCQIDDLRIIRQKVIKGGKLSVVITELSVIA